MKITKKIVIPVVAVALAGAAVFAVPKIVSGSGSAAVAVSATPLAKMDLENTVSVTGTVKSEDVTNVYSTLAYQVQSVNVEVGDIVKAGDILCVLDTANLSAQIDSQLAALEKNRATAEHSLTVAQNNLATEQNNQKYDYDMAYENAKKSVEAAQRTLESSKSTLEARKMALESRKIALESRKVALNKAEQDQKAKRKALQEYKDSYGTPTEYEPEYEQVYQAYVQSTLTVTGAENDVVTAENDVINSENDVADAERAVENAREDYEKAKETADANFGATIRQQEKALISGQQQVQSAAISADLTTSVMQIDELKKDLEAANVAAPVSGVVTAVLATEGGSGQGLLFVIENTEKLKIDTKIEEYDIPNVQPGQQAKIKSDGTGDNEYEGKVSKIAPTALKAANGSTVETTDVQFATEVGIVDGSGLKIGMNARIDIVTEKKDSVFAVSYDAVVENENGESVVYVARPQAIVSAENGDGNMPPVSMSKDEFSQLEGEGEPGQEQIAERREGQQMKQAADGQGSVVAVAVPVKTGMETDFYIEIISDSLREGDLIISNPVGIADGQEVTLGGAAGARRAGGMAGGPGGPGGMAVRMG